MANDIKFRGSNNTKTLETFMGRTLYHSLAYTDDLNVPVVSPTFELDGRAIPYTKDFWFVENLFYGRVDPSYNVVEPNRIHLKSIPGDSTSNVIVLSFVADAFRDFVREYRKRSLSGNIRGKNPTFTNLTAKQGYSNPSAAYKKYISRIYYEFAGTYLSQKKEFAINSFEDFVGEFLNFLKIRSQKVNNPITKSAFLVGNRLSPMITGLCIEIDRQDHAEDTIKVDKFIKDIDFEFYSQLATKYGFLIDKNAPWRLVANVNSPEMLAYSYNRGAGSRAKSGLDHFFARFFRMTFISELEELRTQFLQSYNTFVDANSVTKNTYVKNGAIVIEQKTRSPITREEYDLVYGTTYWFDIYVQIKNIETGCGYSGAELRRIVKTASDLFKLDNYKSLSYINRKFKGFSHRSGSLFYELHKGVVAEAGREDADIMEEIRFASRKAKTILY